MANGACASRNISHPNNSASSPEASYQQPKASQRQQAWGPSPRTQQRSLQRCHTFRENRMLIFGCSANLTHSQNSRTLAAASHVLFSFWYRKFRDTARPLVGRWA
ncbi:hypothetical protein J3459_019219 [Metarhizium acridum]|uniref:uncharacterized protein n=1 Tax=Metarhizium acridum TaxID=92637 RepID=UPI001C6CD1A8|nr:hypothetical protein J3459_019219 [Metarhizium acridum]KAG8410126.1 hypothetical protein J3458_019194 [Metarhizium acridum]